MGNILKHGVEMYKQAMNPKQAPAPSPALYKETQKTKKPVYTPKPADDGKAPKESKYRRVAKFLILIGSENAAEILAELDPEQVAEISKEIAFIKIIRPEEREEIFAEFHELFSKPYVYSGSSQGGIETARRILYAVKGPEKGEEILNKAVPESKENIFSFLEDFSAEQLVMLLKEESAQTAALILSRMPPKISAGTISRLAPDRKAEVLLRMARQSEVAPEVLEQVSAALKEKARLVGSGSKDIEIDGLQTLAAILKNGDYSFGDRLINEIEDVSPEIGQNLKEKLYTLDDIIGAVDRPIQEKLKTMTDYDIVVLLKGRKDDFYEKIMSCVSAGRRKTIREEDQITGAVPRRECDEAARNFLAWFRTARENGDILLYSDEDIIV
ncbi:MAG: flagellar motor switch protein FliG [Treponema sp.]|nr:flagellar motor switch protein FliG [Treponema sp.]